MLGRPGLLRFPSDPSDGRGLIVFPGGSAGGSAPPFVPTDIANLQAWYDVNTPIYQEAAGSTPATAEGALVGNIPDLSGNARTLTCIDANRPTLHIDVTHGRSIEAASGKRLITSSFLDTSYDTAFTLIGCVRADPGAYTGLDIWLSTNPSGLFFYTSSGNFVYVVTTAATGTDIGGSALVNDDQSSGWRVETRRWNGSAFTTRANGREQVLTGVSGNLGLNGARLTLGTYIDGNFPWCGGWSQAALFNRALSDAEILQVEEYFRAQSNAPVLLQDRVRVLFDGDSLTAAPTSNYPKLTEISYLWDTHQAIVVGVGGQRSEDLIANAPTRVDADPGPIVVCWIGRNDWVAGNDEGAAATYANIVSYCSGRRALGKKVVVCTIQPSSFGNESADYESHRSVVNPLIVANWSTFADALADIAANADIGAFGASDNATYYVDKVHMTAAGQAIAAGIVGPAIQSVM